MQPTIYCSFLEVQRNKVKVTVHGRPTYVIIYVAVVVRKQTFLLSSHCNLLKLKYSKIEYTNPSMYLL